VAVYVPSSQMISPIRAEVNLAGIRRQLSLESTLLAFWHIGDWLKGSQTSRSKFGYLTALAGMPGWDDPLIPNVLFVFGVKNKDLAARMAKEYAPHVLVHSADAQIFPLPIF
jgi:hypothetical protein